MKPQSTLPLLFLTGATSSALARSDDTPLPLVIWHGLGDTASSEGNQQVQALAEEVHPGIFVHGVQIGATANDDRSASFLGNASAQVDQFCDTISSHPILSTAPAIDALGFSQGGLFLRAYAERCTTGPPIRSLVTYGAPHLGISEFNSCEGTAASIIPCKAAMALLRFNTWSDFVQNRVIPAQYYRDPAPGEYEKYLEHSAFLADINNERALKKPEYGDKLAELQNLVLVMFDDDRTLTPKESAWFGRQESDKVESLHSAAMYRDDWLGLRRLDEQGRLIFRKVPGRHMQIETSELRDVFDKYFGRYEKKKEHKSEAPVDEL